MFFRVSVSAIFYEPTENHTGIENVKNIFLYTEFELTLLVNFVSLSTFGAAAASEWLWLHNTTGT